MKKPNEEDAASSLLQILPFITGVEYEKGESPDDIDPKLRENPEEPDVDFIFKPKVDDFPSVAIEHTILERFKGQRGYGYRSFDIVEKVEELCRGYLPSDRYYALVPSSALVLGLQKQAISRFVDEISKKILVEAPKLKVDGYIDLNYEGQSVTLMCGGSIPELNGTLGRFQTYQGQEGKAELSLWGSIEHGLRKFPKYKSKGYETLLALEDISGSFHGSPLIKLPSAQRHLIDKYIDHVIAFISNQDRMIVGNLWKEKGTWYDITPFHRRFMRHSDGKWSPQS
jgi:hypothetical protein